MVGYECHIVMPDDMSQEKYAILERLGATVEKVRPVSIVDENHFVNVAKRKGEEEGFFCNQFENLVNFEVNIDWKKDLLLTFGQGSLANHRTRDLRTNWWRN